MEKTAAKSIYTTHDLSRLLHVNPRSVINWIEQDLLQSFRTPGGHRRVRHEDLLSFLRKHNMPIPGALVGGTLSVLIVDGAGDNAIQRAVESQPNYKVNAVPDGMNALIALGRERPLLVILDLQTSGVDALEFCRRIKGDPQGSTAILAIGPDETGKAAALEAGADTFLSRPLNADVLVAQMKKLLQLM